MYIQKIIENADISFMELHTEAVIPWGWIIAATAAIIGWLTIIIVATATTEVEGKTLAVLGMKEAGKTQLYNNLKRKEYKSYQQTSTDDYEGFTFKYGDKIIKIERGRDIGGGEPYVKAYYKQMIEEKDIIFFVFDAACYITNCAYAKDVNARMDFVWRHMKEKYIEDAIIKTKLVTIGSHLDKIKKNKQPGLIAYFQQEVNGKSYSKMFHENFIVANLTDQESFIKILIEKKIFG